MKKQPIIAIDADPDDPEDRPVSVDRLENAHTGRRIRRLRHRLGLTQAGFAERYGIPLASIRQYEIGRVAPPLAVRAYLAVIAEEPQVAAEAYRRSRAA